MINPELCVTDQNGVHYYLWKKQSLYDHKVICSRSKVKVKLLFFGQFSHILNSKLPLFVMINPELYVTDQNGVHYYLWKKQSLYEHEVTCSRSKVKVKSLNFTQFCQNLYSKLLFFSLIDPETYLNTYTGYILLDYDKMCII